MVETLVEGLEIGFARMIITKIHERAFKTPTIYLFQCLIFQLCRDVGVPIWHYDRLCKPTSTLDIGIIKDEANVVALQRGLKIELAPLSENLADTMELV